MKISLDVDCSEASRKLSFRERAGVKILIVIFCIVFPKKFSHQTDEFFKDILNSIEQ